jgi:hypothetical protein
MSETKPPTPPDAEVVLKELFTATLEALLDKIKSGDATAQDLNVARQMLKDNGISSHAQATPKLGSLADMPNFQLTGTDG